MSQFKLGDVVSLSRAQSILVEVADPLFVGETLTLSLPINGVATDFSVISGVGELAADIAVRLIAKLKEEQTEYSVEPSLNPKEFVVAGELGRTFTFNASVSIFAFVLEPAFSALGPDGLQIGPLRVIVSESIVGLPPREFFTRDVPSGDVRGVNVLFVRELDTGNAFEVDAAKVLTVIST